MATDIDIKSSIKIDVTGMNTLSEVCTITVEAFDKVAVTVDPGTASVDVHPSALGNVKFLFISSSAYENLTYTVTTTGGETNVALDGPQVLLGSGAVSLLGASPQTISFTNSGTASVDVEIWLGRDPTTPPPSP